MPHSPCEQQLSAVESMMQTLSLEEKVAHLLMPEDRKYEAADWERILGEVPLGCAFLQARDTDRIVANIHAIQEKAKQPVLIAADMENGFLGGTVFPRAMAFGAADDAEPVRTKGRALAREARAAGIHWCFGPVVDLQLNWLNPESNTRAFGDDPARVARLAAAQIEGMQEESLLAATAKHFPGAGTDDRDQHLCTAVNDLTMDEWQATYGAVWRHVIEAGVLTVMAGHISLPAYEGLEATPSNAMPCTLNPKLQIDLLRRELGFDGVIVSDAAPMIGMASRVRAEEQALQNILTGSDVYLFADPVEDFRRLLAAVKDGRLTEERIDESVRRILLLKQRLGVHETPFGPAVLSEQTVQHESAARAIAEKSITLLKNDGSLPLSLRPGAKIVTTTITNPDSNRHPSLDVVADELAARGFEVEHLINPDHRTLAEKAAEADHVFVNIQINMHTYMAATRLIGSSAMSFWRGWWINYPGKVTVTSFGSPYHLHEIPSLPNMVLAYGESPFSQQAAVKVWLGELEPQGRCPVRLPV